jgi:hypothetical protein
MAAWKLECSAGGRHIADFVEEAIYRLAKIDPTLPMLKLGGAVRFPRERLLRWLAMREQGHRRTRHPLYSPANSAENRESA